MKSPTRLGAITSMWRWDSSPPVEMPSLACVSVNWPTTCARRGRKSGVLSLEEEGEFHVQSTFLQGWVPVPGRCGACADGQPGDAKRGMPFWLYRKVFFACSWMASLRRALKAFPGMIISLSQSENDSHIGTESVSHIETESVCHIGKGEAPRTGSVTPRSQCSRGVVWPSAAWLARTRKSSGRRYNIDVD